MTGTHSLISHRRIWAIAAPMILANLSTPILGMVDTAVMGHLSSAIYLGAIAIGAMIFSFLFWGFGFLRMVTTGLTSQAQSAETQRIVFIESTLLATAIAGLLLLLQTPISWLAFQLIDASEAVKAEAGLYFDIRIWSAPATLLNYVIMGWLIGSEKTRAALAIALIVNSVNIVLDLLLVNVAGMKTEGVALATVIAEYSGLLLGLSIVYRHGLRPSIQQLNTALLKLLDNRRALSVHFNFMLRTLCLIFSFAFFTNQGAAFGDVTLAANMVLLNFITVMAYVLDAFANATEVFAGQALGQKNKALLKSGLLRTGAWSFAAALCFSLGYYYLGEQMIAMLTSIEAVAATAQQYLPWLILAPLLGVWSYLFDGLFVGATLGKEMRNTMLIAVFLFYLPVWYLLQPYGNHGLWASLLTLLAARGLIQACYLPAIFTKAMRSP